MADQHQTYSQKLLMEQIERGKETIFKNEVIKKPKSIQQIMIDSKLSCETINF